MSKLMKLVHFEAVMFCRRWFYRSTRLYCTTEKRRTVIGQDKMRYLSQAEAVAIDEELFNEYRFSVDQLMELAGLSCAQAVYDQHRELLKEKVLVLVGPGNNGGDGLGFRPTVLYPKASRTELMSRLVTQTEHLFIPVIDKLKMSPIEVSRSFPVLIDALFGFSFKAPIRAPFDQIIDTIAQSDSHIVSIDIPSGWNVETGPPNDGSPVLQPQTLISLTAPKQCAQYFHGVHYLGGRFVSPALAEKYKLTLPVFPGSNQFVRLN